MRSPRSSERRTPSGPGGPAGASHVRKKNTDWRRHMPRGRNSRDLTQPQKGRTSWPCGSGAGPYGPCAWRSESDRGDHTAGSLLRGEAPNANTRSRRAQGQRRQVVAGGMGRGVNRDEAPVTTRSSCCVSAQRGGRADDAVLLREQPFEASSEKNRQTAPTRAVPGGNWTDGGAFALCRHRSPASCA